MNNYEPIHMGCFLSDPYIAYAGASWVSLFEHTSAWITLHLLCASEDYPIKSLVLSHKNRERLVDFVRSYGHNIVFYELDKLATPDLVEAAAAKAKKEKAGRFSGMGVCSYGYVMILRLLPKYVKRYIAFGVDCMFTLDVRELQEMQLDEFGIASVSEQQATMNHMVEKEICTSGVVAPERYFCNEIMVYDLDKVRARPDILLPGIKVLMEHPEYDCSTQDLMNYYWAKDYQQLPVKYGVFVDGLRVIGKQELEPAIYHFAGIAVDVFQTDDVYTRAFIGYWKKSPFCNEAALMDMFALPEKVQSETITNIRKICSILATRTLLFAGPATNEAAIRKIFQLEQPEDYLALSIENNILQLDDLLSVMSSGQRLCLIFLPRGYDSLRLFLIDKGFIENKDFANGSLLLTSKETGMKLYGRRILLDEIHP